MMGLSRLYVGRICVSCCILINIIKCLFFPACGDLSEMGVVSFLNFWWCRFTPFCYTSAFNMVSFYGFWTVGCLSGSYLAFNNVQNKKCTVFACTVYAKAM
ncbi:hypothetical protein QBC44DRAFT_146787 [Cladorrhinum sp. PSN332]|nr:hypothetical protein QBC44DRAFT_146787 [Cladorrhinum sp. PSN332]